MPEIKHLVYAQVGLIQSNLQCVPMSTFDWLFRLHQETNHAIINDIKEYKTTQAAAMFANGFGDPSDPLFPEVTAERDLPRSADERVKLWGPKYQDILRDFIAIDLDDDDPDRLAADKQSIQANLANVQYAFYPSIQFPKLARAHLIVSLDGLVNADQYRYLLRKLTKELNLTLDDQANFTVAHTINAPVYRNETDQAAAVFNFGTDIKPLALNDALADYAPSVAWQRHLSSAESKSETNPSAPLSVKTAGFTQTTGDEFKDLVLSYVTQKHFQREVEDYQKFWRFTEGIAAGVLRQDITRQQADFIMEKVANGNTTWESSNQKEFETEFNKLSNNPDKLKLVKPISQFLPTPVDDYQNLGEYFQEALLSPEFKPSSKMTILTATRYLEQSFSFALLSSANPKDINDLVLYNPLSGLWEHDENEFYMLLNILKPAASPTADLTTLMASLGARARLHNHFVQPYSGSRYLLFTNGVLDLVDNVLIPISDPMIKDLKFTERHLHSIDYVEDAPEPEFENDRPDGGVWTPGIFVDGYTSPKAPDHAEIKRYFLFGLSLGLLAGHNTSVNFDIEGPSRLGKTTWWQIFNEIYDAGRAAQIVYARLNEPFPVTNYNLNTAILWVKECNKDTEPLNNENGTQFYDGVADNQFRFSVKHGADIIVDNPPQMFIDGTQYIQASEMDTGPAGRTLAYHIDFDGSIAERDRFYSNSITERLSDTQVLQYLISEMVKAFRATVPMNRIPDFRMNLAKADDLDLIPARAQEWRRQLVNADLRLTNWFEDEVEEFLLFDMPLHVDEFYMMYLASEARHSRDKHNRFAQGPEKFEKNLMKILNNREGWTIDYTSHARLSYTTRSGKQQYRRKVNSPDKTGIDWKQYSQSYPIPAGLDVSNIDKNLFRTNIQGWFEIHTTTTTTKVQSPIKKLAARSAQQTSTGKETENAD